MPPSGFYPPLTENDSPSLNQQRPPPPPPPPPPLSPMVFGPQINSSAQSVFSAGGSTLSPNNLNLLEKDAFQVQNSVVAQFVTEGQGTDENSISSPPNISIQFVHDLDEVAPMSIPVEFRPHSSSVVTEPKHPIEIIDSVAPQSVPAESLSNFYLPYNQYKFQMSSDGNPVPSYNSPSSTAGKESFWNSQEQFKFSTSYGPSIQLHPKWPNLNFYTPEFDQSPSSNVYNSFTIIPPSLSPSPPVIVPYIQQSQVQGPFAPEMNKPDSNNQQHEISVETQSKTTITLNSSLTDIKNTTSNEQQVTMHHLSSDGELTILKVGPKEDNNKNEKNDHDKNSDDNNVNESDFNEIETEDDHRIDEDDDEEIENDTLLQMDFDDSLYNPDSKADKTKYIVLQKLPNGGAIDLENMQTYTMEDFASDIQNSNKQNDLTNERPRSFQKSLDGPIESINLYNNFTESEDITTLQPFSDFLLPVKLLISERPPPLPEIYEPIPLSQLEDQEAMSDSQDEHPVYIIYEKALFPEQEEHEMPESLANIELFKISSNSTIQAEANKRNHTSDSFSTDHERQLDDNQLDENIHNNDQIGPSEIPKVEWTPIPIQELRPTLKTSSIPVVEPEWPPFNYQVNKQDSNLDPSDIGHLSKVTLADTKEQNNVTQEIKNIQLLPPRLSAVLMQVNNQNRFRSLSSQASVRQTTGLSRENKIAPIFKYELSTTDDLHGRGIPQQQLRPSSPPPTQTATRSSVRQGIIIIITLNSFLSCNSTMVRI